MRKLASIQKIWDVVPIENADAIELVKVLGWQCVAKKGEFNKGDLCIYFEIDSFLPVKRLRRSGQDWILVSSVCGTPYGNLPNVVPPVVALSSTTHFLTPSCSVTSSPIFPVMPNSLSGRHNPCETSPLIFAVLSKNPSPIMGFTL